MDQELYTEFLADNGQMLMHACKGY